MISGPRTASSLRVAAWWAAWVLLIAFVCSSLGLDGWPWRLTRAEPYLLSSPHNSWIHAGFSIERLRHQDVATQQNQYVLIGGSACLEAITSDSDMQRRLRSLASRNIGFTSICSSYTTLTDVGKIAHRLNPFRGTLLLLVEPAVFTKGVGIQLVKEKPDKTLPKYYFLRIPRETRNVLESHGLTLLPFHDERAYLVGGPADLIKSLHHLYPLLRLGTTRTYDRHTLHKRAPEDRIEKFVAGTAENIRRNKTFNTELYTAAIKIAKRNGAAVALVNLPNAAPYRDGMRNAFPDYDQVIEGLVKTNDIGHFDLRKLDEWPREDFWDVHHLTPAGQEKFSRYLARLLAEAAGSGVGKRTGRIGRSTP